MNYKIIVSAILSILPLCLQAQNSDSIKTDIKKDKIKTGWNFGALPVLAFDVDKGLQYGALANIFHYGDGSLYPEYKHSIYLEWSRTTKGSGITQLVYDSKYLIPKIRVTAEASLLTEKALDFYGFNGYESFYDTKLEDTLSSFYRYNRKLIRLKADFQGKINGSNFLWFAGFTHFNTIINEVDSISLLHNYNKWGLIPENQQKGGTTNMLTLGLVYDTRDNEPNPMKGIWTEALLLSCPSFLDNKFAYYRLAITHRQYFTLKQEVLNLAYRLSYQAKISGTMPSFMLPYFYNPKLMRDGLGGAKTLRGIKRNRVVGEDFMMGNVELRWKFIRTIIWNQNIYLAAAPFADFGRIIGKYPIEVNNTLSVTERNKAQSYLSEGKDESWHLGYGAGLYIAMNRNFIVAISYGLAADKMDGNSGFYMNLEFLF